MTREDYPRFKAAGRAMLTAESAGFCVRALAHAAELQALFPVSAERYAWARRRLVAAINSQRRAWAEEDKAAAKE